MSEPKKKKSDKGSSSSSSGSHVEGKLIQFKEQDSISLVAYNEDGPGTQLIMEGVTLFASQKYSEAISVFDRMIADETTQSIGLIFKALIYKQLGDRAKSMECYEQVIKVDPKNWIAYNNRGVIFKETRSYDAAISSLKLSIQLGPKEGNVAKDNLAVVLTDYGTRLKISGRISESKERYLEALIHNPTYAPAYYNLGVLYGEQNNFEEAFKHYEAAIRHNPLHVEAIGNLGVLNKNRGHLTKAIQLYERALTINPNFTIAKSNLAIAYTDLGTKVKVEGDIKLGIEYYQKALSINKSYGPAWYNLGVAHAESGRHDDAIKCYEYCISFDPKCAEAYNNMGVIYKDNKGNLDKAIYYYRKALEANPKFAQTLNNLGVVYSAQGRLDEAEQFCQQAVANNKRYAEAYNNLGVICRDEGRIRKAIEYYEKCLEIEPNSRNAGPNRLLAMNSLLPLKIGETDQQLSDRIYLAHKQWGDRFLTLYNPYTTWEVKMTTDRPLRVGYLSGDFFTHSVSYFIEAPLQFGDRKKVINVAYSNLMKGDGRTTFFQSIAHEWRSVVGLSAQQAARMIREDKIDILIELAGHTSGNRLDIMAMKPAPIQVTWIGYPNTTGLSTIDFRFTDGIVDEVETKQKYTEKLVRLPTAFLCYTPPHDVPTLTEPALSRNGYITFGSFNNLAKVNNRVLRCWSEILKAVPESKMLLKCKPFISPALRAKFHAKFEKWGIDQKRIDLTHLRPSNNEHLSVYNDVDLSLDTFPYAGTTTTCEALVMGVPVITLAKTSHHSHNVGNTLLSRVKGLNELVAFTEQEYIDKAIALAKDTEKLKTLRQTIRDAFKESEVCDGKTFTAGLEEVYHQLWRTYVAHKTGKTSAPSSSSTSSPSSPSSPSSSSK